VIAKDRELELWKQEWQAEAASSISQLRARVRFQTARMIASNLAGLSVGVAVLIYAARIVLREPTPRTIVWGTAVLLCWLATFVFVVWNQIGIWRVETESTRAYAELSYKRSLTKIRKIRFMLVLFSCGLAFDFAYLSWEDWRVITQQPSMVFAHLARVSVAFLAWWLFIKWYGRRKAQQVEQARRFVEELER
jgi:hypothetical protein